MSLPGSYICPHCGVTVVFNPRPILRSAKAPYDASREFYQFGSVALKAVDVFDLGEFCAENELIISSCVNCGRPTLWEYEKLVWPVSSGIKAYEKMPEKAKRVFNEAQSLMQLSPRSCCALLRLCVEEIVNYVGAEQGLKNFDPDWILARRIEALSIIFAPVLSDLLISRNWPMRLRLRGKPAKIKAEVILLSLFWFLPYKAERQVL